MSSPIFLPPLFNTPPRVSVLRAALSGHPVSAWIDRALYICKSHSFPFQSVIDNLWSVLIDTGMSLYAPDCVYLLSVYRRIKLKRRDKAPEVIGKKKTLTCVTCRIRLRVPSPELKGPLHTTNVWRSAGERRRKRRLNILSAPELHLAPRRSRTLRSSLLHTMKTQTLPSICEGL